MLGGIGIYSTLTDYLALLRHLLLAKGAFPSPSTLLLSFTHSLTHLLYLIPDGNAPTPILSAASVALLFAPSVPEGATAPISEFSGMPDCQFGYGLCIATTDWEGRRRKGAGFCKSFSSPSISPFLGSRCTVC